jgi:hypothetical protein
MGYRVLALRLELFSNHIQKLFAPRGEVLGSQSPYSDLLCHLEHKLLEHR